MRILCLHGAGTNSEIFRIQLGSVIHNLLQDDPTLSFEFYDAEVECPPAKGIEALSEGPFYEWYSWDPQQRILPAETTTDAIDNVLDMIAEEGPFDGVVGFSQGAAIIASVLAHYSKQNPLQPQTNLFKFAMFICGSKPFTYDGMSRIDHCCKPIVQIPTAHVVGKKDQWYKESLGLFALCDSHSAKIYDHGQGHSLPVNPQTTGVVSQMFKNLSAKAEFASSRRYTAPWQTFPNLPPMPKPNFNGTAHVNGINIWYATFGTSLQHSKAKGLNPVVFLHGGFANSDYWANQIRYLKDYPYSLITIDSRAHGRSSDDTSRPLTYDLMTEDVIALMDHLGIKKFSTVGWSDGGIISFDLAMNYTKRIDRIFSFGGSYSPKNINATIEKSPVFSAYLKQTEKEYKRNSPSHGSFKAFADRMNTMWETLPAWDAKSFSKITTRYTDPNAPIIWIVDGDSEEAVTRTTPGELHSWIWGSDLLILPGVSHFAFMQDPKTFNVMLQRFLEIPRFDKQLYDDL
ncbi:hypothetical protein F53441_12380 [Fusarium austroafricanum]|uniref:AB hydrolase-1 domain-containing protein n=1 Tax=Fusarium austroafricanum TaxID=2364996 RepID=A0A8H4NP47_9HYPO|nr:hypothetical protein F53441_12380 [Fusarium austroafricanum]